MLSSLSHVTGPFHIRNHRCVRVLFFQTVAFDISLILPFVLKPHGICLSYSSATSFFSLTIDSGHPFTSAYRDTTYFCNSSVMFHCVDAP